MDPLIKYIPLLERTKLKYYQPVEVSFKPTTLISTTQPTSLMIESVYVHDDATFQSEDERAIELSEEEMKVVGELLSRVREVGEDEDETTKNDASRFPAFGVTHTTTTTATVTPLNNSLPVTPTSTRKRKRVSSRDHYIALVQNATETGAIIPQDVILQLIHAYPHHPDIFTPEFISLLTATDLLTQELLLLTRSAISSSLLESLRDATIDAGEIDEASVSTIRRVLSRISTLPLDEDSAISLVYILKKFRGIGGGGGDGDGDHLSQLVLNIYHKVGVFVFEELLEGDNYATFDITNALESIDDDVIADVIIRVRNIPIILKLNKQSLIERLFERSVANNNDTELIIAIMERLNNVEKYLNMIYAKLMKNAKNNIKIKILKILLKSKNDKVMKFINYYINKYTLSVSMKELLIDHMTFNKEILLLLINDDGLSIRKKIIKNVDINDDNLCIFTSRLTRERELKDALYAKVYAYLFPTLEKEDFGELRVEEVKMLKNKLKLIDKYFIFDIKYSKVLDIYVEIIINDKEINIDLLHKFINFINNDDLLLRIFMKLDMTEEQQQHEQQAYLQLSETIARKMTELIDFEIISKKLFKLTEIALKSEKVSLIQLSTRIILKLSELSNNHTIIDRIYEKSRIFMTSDERALIIATEVSAVRGEYLEEMERSAVCLGRYLSVNPAHLMENIEKYSRIYSEFLRNDPVRVLEFFLELVQRDDEQLVSFVLLFIKEIREMIKRKEKEKDDTSATTTTTTTATRALVFEIINQLTESGNINPIETFHLIVLEYAVFKRRDALELAERLVERYDFIIQYLRQCIYTLYSYTAGEYGDYLDWVQRVLKQKKGRKEMGRVLRDVYEQREEMRGWLIYHAIHAGMEEEMREIAAVDDLVQECLECGDNKEMLRRRIVEEYSKGE